MGLHSDGRSPERSIEPFYGGLLATVRCVNVQLPPAYEFSLQIRWRLEVALRTE